MSSLWSKGSLGAACARLSSDSVPVYEYLLDVAALTLDNQAVLVIQDSGSERDTRLIPVTWRQLNTAIHSRAAELVRLIGLPPRVLGDAPFVVGLLGQNGYQYLVTWLALFALRWTVCHYPFTCTVATELMIVSVAHPHLTAEFPRGGIAFT